MAPSRPPSVFAPLLATAAWPWLLSAARVGHLDTLRDHIVAAGGGDGKLTCCCSSFRGEATCKYRVVRNGGTTYCCKMRKGGCPILSMYWKKDDDWCYGGKKDFWGRMRAHPKYVLVDLETHDPVKKPEALEVLGKGSFGRAYLAQVRKSNRLVVLKVPANPLNLAKMSKGCSDIQRLHRLISNVANQTSNHALHVMNCIEDDTAFDPPFVVLENAGRSPLKTMFYLDAKGVLALMKQVFYALASFHSSRPPMVHHDLKWQNVAYDAASGCLKLIDLDDAMPATPSFANEADGVAFTRSHAPPEFLDAETNFKCDETARFDGGRFCRFGYSYDAYSAGVMLAATLCGAPQLMASKAAFGDMWARVPQEEWAEMEHDVFRTSLSLALKEDIGLIPMQDQVEYLRLNARYVDDKHPWSSTFHANLQFCERKLQHGQLRLVDALRAERPERRPSPLEVLERRLFKGVSTGCSLDGSG